VQRDPTSSERDGAADPARPRPARIWLAALAVALVVALLLPATLDWTVRAAAGLDAAMLAVLGRLWALILRSDAAATRRRAAVEDPGRVGVLVVTLLVSLAGLVAAIVLIRRPEDFAPLDQSGWLIGLGVVGVAAGWLLMHTAFTLHYAHLYYRDRGRPGGLTLAGGPPDDRDFAYFSFTIGMTYQTADVTITERPLRWATLAHALLAFIFNTLILALAVNVLFGRLQ
jgi:uncharacterized membrane protein